VFSIGEKKNRIDTYKTKRFDITRK